MLWPIVARRSISTRWARACAISASSVPASDARSSRESASATWRARPSRTRSSSGGRRKPGSSHPRMKAHRDIVVPATGMMRLRTGTGSSRDGGGSRCRSDAHAAWPSANARVSSSVTWSPVPPRRAPSIGPVAGVHAATRGSGCAASAPPRKASAWEGWKAMARRGSAAARACAGSPASPNASATDSRASSARARDCARCRRLVWSMASAAVLANRRNTATSSGVNRSPPTSRLAFRTPTTRPPTSRGTETAELIRPPFGARLGNRDRSSPSFRRTGVPVWATRPATPSPSRIG